MNTKEFSVTNRLYRLEPKHVSKEYSLNQSLGGAQIVLVAHVNK